MKVGIIVHSHTGNTLAVAQRLKEKLLAKGHSVNLEQVMAVNEDPSAAGNIQLKTVPDISDYDGLIFGAPVRAFSLSPVMKAYLSQLPSLKGKKVGCFVTQYFPYGWMGGTRSVKQMKKFCEAKDENVFAAGIVNWSHKEREKRITDVLERLTRL
ncbi:MAG: flavodoxin family protein [Bacillota bacterium]